jgi:hypothetical protein
MNKTEWQDSDKMKDSPLVSQLTSLKKSLDDIILDLKEQRKHLVKKYEVDRGKR